MARRQQQHVEPALLLIALREERIDVAEGHLAIRQGGADLFLQPWIIDLQSLFVRTGRRNRRRLCLLKDFFRRHQPCHDGSPSL